jgi:uncharacterized protein (TIGR02145 family)
VYKRQLIANVTDVSLWKNLTTPAFCWYDNDATTNRVTYGGLYNWYAVNTGKLAPKGWHVATDAEWTTLENYLIANGYNYDGTTKDNKYAKALANTTGWIISSKTGTVGNSDYPTKRNATGFSALPGGFIEGGYNIESTFHAIGFTSVWWSSSELDGLRAWWRELTSFDNYGTRGNNDKTGGKSIRCVKD